MSAQQYYQQGPPPPQGYPQYPQQSYGGPPPQQGYYQQGPPMQYQQQPPPRKNGGGGCLTACLAALCCCCVAEEGSSYQGVVGAQPPKSSSPTWGHWALFSVQAPLVNAFQDAGTTKESLLKVESTGDGELADLVDDFNEGRIQFAFVKVKDPNTGLPKNVLIAWCGGGVPERTKGYFTSHAAAVAKVLHGYHVQITARSDSDLDPAAILQKVADASGAKYSAGAASVPSAHHAAPPPVAKKPPVFTPTSSAASSGSFDPLVAARNRRLNGHDDGWGPDAPDVTRTELQKVESAYKPTKVNMVDLLKNRDESRSGGPPGLGDRPDVVKGAYQPVGKVDIAAIRSQAQRVQDDRPATVKGAYEPVGKVDIAAIRAKAQRPTDAPDVPADDAAAPKGPEPGLGLGLGLGLAERSAAFHPSERLTELPRPKVAKKFGGAPFTGTKAPTPGGLGFGGTAVPAAAPVGAASRTFADQNGKTPAQLWAEKKAKQGGVSPTFPSAAAAGAATSPLTAQQTGGEWKSGYAGKSWAPVQTGNTGRTGVDRNLTGASVEADKAGNEPPVSPGAVSALRDRFKGATPMGTNASAYHGLSAPDDAGSAPPPPPPPPPPAGSRPSAGFALPGLPSRPAAQDDEEQDEQEYEAEREPSPIRVAMPVGRGQQPEREAPRETLPVRPVPVPEALPDEEETYDPRAAGTQEPATGGHRAVAQYDYEKAEDNELELRDGETITNIEMVDDDWWMGTNSRGESGLFPSNYVELVPDDGKGGLSGHIGGAGAAAAAAAAAAAPPEAAPPAHDAGPTAIAMFDYEAAEDNELSFPENAKITDLEFPDEDWWFGHYNGASGLFPANYVQRES
ncbi:hypothetical protein P8C59_003360 [Phyllachora maydis]|uniref:Actin binding protein n=1 Tax=Phyllachora maydis TaxID=1825666 RepID=A0AAD9MA98_9PEZI|nr:hypothetical protein P8C59_003360 [Phyllachora maydis]